MNETQILSDFQAGVITAEDVLAFYEWLDTARRPLSAGQQGLWLLHKLNPESDVYNVPICFRVTGRLDVAALRAAFGHVVARHGLLGCALVEDDGEPYLVSRPDRAPLFRHEQTDGRTRAEMMDVLRAVAKTPFDLHHDPLARAYVHTTGPAESYVLLVVHHLVFDGASTPILLRDLLAAYDQLRAGNQPPEQPDADNYRDFVDWETRFLAGPDAERAQRHWRETLRGPLPALRLDIEADVPARTAATGRTHTTVLTPEVTERVRELCADGGIRPAVLFLAIYQLMLHRYSGARDLIVGVPSMGRPGSAYRDTVGYFVNMVPLRQEIPADLPFRRHLHELTLRLADGLDHATYPFPQLVRDLNLQVDPGAAPVFQVSYAFQNRNMMHVAGDVLDVELARSMEFVPDLAQEGEYKLHLEVFENADDYTLHLKYDANRFAAAAVDRFLRHCQVLLAELLADPNQRLDAPEHLSAAERHQVLVEWNDTARPFSADRSLPELLAATVARHPDRTAVLFGDRSLTYAEFSARVDLLARELRGRGVTTETVVGVCMRRSMELVVTLWAVLRAGGAYLPLEPAYPAARTRYLIENSAAQLVLTQPGLATPGLAAADTVLEVDADGRLAAADAGQATTDDDAWPAGSDHLAYVIYTSGSTGQPKGVMVEHRAVVNRIEWMQHEYRLGADDVVLQKTPFTFDVSVWEFVWPLLAGARMVVTEPDGHRDPAYLAALVRRAGVTTLHFVPSMLRAMLDEPGWAACTKVRQVFCSGEALPPDLVARHNATHPAPLHNLYGPTEAAIDVSSWTCPRQPVDVVPIGRPIRNIQLYVLGPGMRPVGVGCVGELHIAGVGLARGYRNSPELTAERFVPNPFGPGRLYRTGDLARWSADGTIEYLGRVDHQVKVRGFRIELGEIEARLAAHLAVRACAVLARTDGDTDTRLVGYVVTEPDEFDHAALVEHLAAALPDYLVPSALVRLDTLPVTVNGKLDRAALPAPDVAAYAVRDRVAPHTQTERTLVAVCAELLGFPVDAVGVGDNFFALGGHSLLIPKLTSRLAGHGLRCDLHSVFAAASFAELAATIDGVDDAAAPPVSSDVPLLELTGDELATVHAAVPGGPANLQDVYPLAALQEGMLFHHLKDSSRDPYVLTGVFAFADRSRLDAFVDALRAVIARHDALRTAVLTVGMSQPVQVVVRDTELELGELDLSPGATVEDEVARLLARSQAMPIDRAPLIRLRAGRHVGTGEWVAVLNLHHLVDDATSLGLLFTEVVAHLTSRENELPVPVPYREFVAHCRLQATKLDAASFFAAQLGDVTEPTVLFGLDDVHGDGRQVADLRQPLDPVLGGRIRDLAKRLRISPAALFHAGWALVAAACADRDDPVFGTVMSGRLQGPAGVDRMLGNFINTLPVRSRLAGRTVAELVADTDRTLRELVRYEQTPLAVAHGQAGVGHDAALFNSILNFRHLEGIDRVDDAELARLGIRPLTGVIERSNYPVAVSVDDLGDAFSIDAQVHRSQDAELVISYLATAMTGIVDAFADDLTAPVPALDVPVLSAGLRDRVLSAWNEVPSGVSVGDRCVHEWFEEVVARTPDAVAVVCEGGSWTYAELNAWANRLAHCLREFGVGPGVLVALCLPRSEWVVVGLLAVLKAGGAYVPLDPDYPVDRLDFLVRDSAPVVLLVDGPLPTGLSIPDVPVLDVRRDAWQWADRPAGNLARLEHGAGSGDLAYVIYTSGSTGEPKGVLVEHRNVTRLFTSTHGWFEFGPDDTWALFHSYAFDFSVWEIWGALLYGGRVVVVAQAMTRDPKAFYRLLCSAGVTVLNQTPSAFRALVAAQGEDQPAHRLRTVIFGGEALDPVTLAPWSRRPVNRGTELVNMYGITETTVHVTYRPLTEADIERGGSPIGRRILDSRTYVLDRRGRPAPVGAIGELYVGGAGVARGYLNRPELTQQRFLPDPFHDEPGARMYRTGDLVRHLPDGQLEYLGRNDNQVKIRGFRIELGEIESTLAEHPAVADARVVARQFGQRDQRLVAYLVPSACHAAALVELARLRRTDPDALADTYELPNGMTVFHHNRSETEFVYEEIFTNLDYLRQGITLRDGDVVFDVGANIGMFTLFVGGRCPNARIFSFEPIPPVFDSLRRNVALHDLNATVLPVGLAAGAGEETFTFYRHNTVISSSRTSAEQAHETVRSFLRSQEEVAGGDRASDTVVDELVDARLDSEGFTCRLRTLSEVVAEHAVTRIDLLKIDVENAEFEVLRGIDAGDWAKIRQLVMEVHDENGRLAEVVTLLRSHGFDVVTEQDNRLLRDTALYNLYARRPEPVEPALEEPPAAPTRWSGEHALRAELSARAAARLPGYMVPAGYVLLDELPLTQNGKLDHRALPDPDEATRQRHHEPPTGDAERAVAAGWAELLGLDADGLDRTSNFFALGGNSLMVTRLVNRLSQDTGVELPIHVVFNAPTLAGMAAELDERAPAVRDALTGDLDTILDTLDQVEGMSDDELTELERQIR